MVAFSKVMVQEKRIPLPTAATGTAVPELANATDVTLSGANIRVTLGDVKTTAAGVTTVKKPTIVVALAAVTGAFPGIFGAFGTVSDVRLDGSEIVFVGVEVPFA